MEITFQATPVINGKAVSARQIEALEAVGKAGTQAAAARALGISAPVLHKYIAGIEDAAGVPVLETTPAGSVLTAEGRRILEEAAEMSCRCDMGRGFTVCCSPVTEDLMLSCLSAAKIEGSHMSVSDDAYNIRMMREGRADLAIIDDPMFLFDAEEFQMEEIGYMGMVFIDRGPSFIQYKYGAQRVAYMYLESEGREYSIDATTFSLAELIGSSKSFFVDEFMLTRRNLKMKSAVDPKMLRHSVTAIYRDDTDEVRRVLKAVRSRNLK